jgi:hypothetical protein
MTNGSPDRLVGQAFGLRRWRPLALEPARGNDGLLSLDDIEPQIFVERGDPIGVAVAERFAQETGHVGEGWLLVADDGDEAVVLVHRQALHALRVDQHGNGDDEPFDGLRHAEPGLVVAAFDLTHGF